jgi:hypothetical protein
VQTEQVGEALAMYTGTLPTPMAVRFATSALRVSFVSAAGNRDAGFMLTFTASGGGGCYRDCSGGGTCVQGLCACDAGRAGADCSIPLPQVHETRNRKLAFSNAHHLAVPSDGSPPRFAFVRQVISGQRVSGRVSVGQTVYYRVEVPADPPGLMMLVRLRPRPAFIMRAAPA